MRKLIEELQSLVEGEPTEVPSEEKAKEVGDAIGVRWDEVPLAEFQVGLAVELEHGTRDPQTDVTEDDWLLTGKIALAHLKELPDYYTKLQKVEPAIAKLRSQLSWARPS